MSGLKNYTRAIGSPAEQDYPLAEYHEGKGYLVWDGEKHDKLGNCKQVYVYSDSIDSEGKGVWGYTVYMDGKVVGDGSPYDTGESALVAGLSMVRADVLPDDPRIRTLSVQMCRELWRKIGDLEASLHLMAARIHKLESKEKE